MVLGYEQIISSSECNHDSFGSHRGVAVRMRDKQKPSTNSGWRV
jgi:hypothetical protein